METVKECKAEALRRVQAGELGKYQSLGVSSYEQAYYEVLRDNGTEPWLAEMQACGVPGIAGTSSAFLAGRSNNQEYDHCASDIRDNYLNKAKKAGVNPRGKVYVSGLAKHPGDPRAWVESPSEVKSRCEKEGWTIIDK